MTWMALYGWWLVSSALAIQQEDAAAPGPAADAALRAGAITYLTPADAPADRSIPEAIDARIAELLASAESEADALRSSQALVGAANRILSFRLARPASSLLLGVATSEDRERLRSSAQEALALLAKAEAKLGPLRDGPAEARAGADDLGRTLPRLQGLAEAMLAAASPPDDRSQVRRIISKLGVLLESDDLQLTSAAALWSAFLAEGVEDRDTVIKNLPPALSEPEASIRTVGFFLRLERCRLLAAKGSWAAALALLTTLEEECESWFPDEEAEAGRRSATLVRIDVLRSWAAELDRQSHGEESAWCRQKIRSLLGSQFDPAGGAPVLPLLEAVPFVVGN